VHAQAQVDNAHCTDEIETGFGADGPVHDTGTHTRHTHEYGERDLGRAKSGTGLPT